MPVVNPVVTWLISSTDLGTIARLTNIRPSRLLSYATGAVTPRVSTLNQLKNTYARLNYNILRAAGTNIKTAQRFKFSSPDKVLSTAAKWNNYAKFISGFKDVDLDTIQLSLSRSDLTDEDLIEDRYK